MGNKVQIGGTRWNVRPHTVGWGNWWPTRHETSPKFVPSVTYYSITMIAFHFGLVLNSLLYAITNGPVMNRDKMLLQDELMNFSPITNQFGETVTESCLLPSVLQWTIKETPHHWGPPTPPLVLAPACCQVLGSWRISNFTGERSGFENAYILAFTPVLLTVGSGLWLWGGFINQLMFFTLKLRETHMSWGCLITVEIWLLMEKKSAVTLGVLSLVITYENTKKVSQYNFELAMKSF